VPEKNPVRMGIMGPGVGLQESLFKQGLRRGTWETRGSTGRQGAHEGMAQRLGVGGENLGCLKDFLSGEYCKRRTNGLGKTKAEASG